MYNYQKIKPELFKEENQKFFLDIRTKVFNLISKSGSVKMEQILIGDSWLCMACVDRLVELGEITEIPTTGFAQHRIFTK